MDRYILGKFLATFFFAIAMIIVIVVMFDYVEKVDDFTELHAPLSEVIFDYYLNFIPYFANQFCSLFTFIACIFFTSKLAYQTEIVAMLSGGMSNLSSSARSTKILLPIVLVSRYFFTNSLNLFLLMGKYSF